MHQRSVSREASEMVVSASGRFSWRRGRGVSAGMGLLVALAAMAVLAACAGGNQHVPADGRSAVTMVGIEQGTEQGTESSAEPASAAVPVPSRLDDAGEMRWLRGESTAADPATVAPLADTMGDPTGWRISIPAVDASASMMSLGVDPTGVMQVPNDGVTVGWYRFTAPPGQSGNAVVAAHVDYRGRAAVFHRLHALQVTDQIVIQAGEETLTYAVDSVTLVRPEAADVTSIVGTREGPATLTLITCGGTWDRARGDYDHRVIVVASLVDSDAGSVS
jgi:LPXTG-site transpeptidase (sortase) family protein